MTRLWEHLPRRALGLRLRIEHTGGPKVEPGVYEGVVVHVDRFESGILDSMELRLDDGREIHVPGATRGEVVTVIAARAA